MNIFLTDIKAVYIQASNARQSAIKAKSNLNIEKLYNIHGSIDCYHGVETVLTGDELY